MARRSEFRPDKSGTSLLSKLYLTRLQRKKLLKWTLFALVLLVLSVLQDVIFCRMDILGATVDLVPCGILVACVLFGTETGSVYTVVASFLYLFSGSSPGYHVPALLTFLGVIGAALRQNYLQNSFGSILLCSGSALLLYELGVFAWAYVFGLIPASRLFAVFFTGVLTLVIIPILYPIYTGIQKIGGESWKE